MKKVQILLLELSKLLSRHSEARWGNAFLVLYKESFRYEGVNYDHYFIREIMNLYGGMGSFNDLILHKDMKPLDEENDQLDSLRNQLYEECVKLRTRRSDK